jgi:UDP-2-acetamido-2,6-beta-L-arabino-hexul-4-ose reductase
MQILVVSDLHRRRSYFEKVLEKYPNINTVFFLGDGADDAADVASFFPDKTVHILSGNCDFLGEVLNLLKDNGNNCPIVLSSSIQASLRGRFADSTYGLSKKAGEDLLIKYSEDTRAKVMIYRFPNIFGKWARPNYNSAVATFCNNIAKDLPITVNDESTELELLYIDDLVEEMICCLMGKEHRDGKYSRFCTVPVTHNVTLGEIVKLL